MMLIRNFIFPGPRPGDPPAVSEPVTLAMEVEAFLRLHGMPATAFGIAALGYRPFVSRLRSGRAVSPKTAAKAREFMEGWGK